MEYVDRMEEVKMIVGMLIGFALAFIFSVFVAIFGHYGRE